MAQGQLKDRRTSIEVTRSARVAGPAKRVAEPRGIDLWRAGAVHSPDGVLAMQRMAGNRAVLAALGAPGGPSRSAGSLASRSRSPLAASSACEPSCGHSHSHGDGPTVQRHSSWEHSLLGDAKPDVLATIGTWQDLVEQTKREGALVGSSNRWYKKNPKKETILGTPRTQTASVNLPGIGAIAKGNVMHTLVQEMARVAKWQTDPPTAASTDKPYDKAGKDPEFEVVTVRLPAEKSKNSLLVTYGELNTLADFYGSLELMKAAAPTQRLQIVQSVRKETFLRLKDIYTRLNDSLTKTERANQDVVDAKEAFKDQKLDKTSFKGAAVPDYISGKAGQADLLAGDKPVIGQGIGAGGGTNAYGATLARNACHFVPESWHAWASYHDKGRKAATDSWAALAKARRIKADMAQEDYSRRPLDKAEAEGELTVAEGEVSKLANEGLLNNGFGDHYLQDSYAAGHMINKTQIMQWYVEFIDKNDKWDYFKDDNWRRAQQMAYGQAGLADAGQYDKTQIKGYDPNNANPNQPRNPQSVENIGGDDWTVRFKALGLQVPPSLATAGTPERTLMEWWQLAAGADSGSRTLTGAQMMATRTPRRMGQPAVEAALLKLVADGVVRTEADNRTRGERMATGMQGKAWADMPATTFILRDDYVPKDMVKFRAALTNTKQGDDSAYQKMASAVTYSDYIMFMESGFLQKATNALHDVFCKGGLDVLTAGGAHAFRVYGDDSMFNAASSEGVKESGITANRSRDSILSIINTGNDGGMTAASILDRLPSRVQFTAGNNVVTQPIEAWHNSTQRGYLKDQCMKDGGIFEDMSGSLMQKFVPGIFGSSLGELTKDKGAVKVHGADAF